MILTIDAVARRYGCLPSELLERGSSLDIIIADISQAYINQKQEEADARASGKPYAKPVPNMSQDQMKAMIERARKYDESRPKQKETRSETTQNV